MSIDVSSLMATVNMYKLLDKETLESYRVIKNHNLQIGEVIDALDQSEPELFGNSQAELMPVNYSNQKELKEQLYIKQMPKGECDYCDVAYAKPTWLFPPHTASPECQSGHPTHCSCSICF